MQSTALAGLRHHCAVLEGSTKQEEEEEEGKKKKKKKKKKKNTHKSRQKVRKKEKSWEGDHLEKQPPIRTRASCCRKNSFSNRSSLASCLKLKINCSFGSIWIIGRFCMFRARVA